MTPSARIPQPPPKPTWSWTRIRVPRRSRNVCTGTIFAMWQAYDNLMALTTERMSFLSTRRCRHFLASIAPHLLQAVSETPDPDSTLVNLSKVSDSLGGKGVLWELFSFNPPSLRLYVRLCASSPYLSGILTSNPGMIDELMDSLVLDKLPTYESLTATLHDLCRGAEDIDPILHSFKSFQHLRVGVRDILGKEESARHAPGLVGHCRGLRAADCPPGI